MIWCPFLIEHPLYFIKVGEIRWYSSQAWSKWVIIKECVGMCKCGLKWHVSFGSFIPTWFQYTFEIDDP